MKPPRWWTRLAVRAAIRLLPPGAPRERYRAELEAEAWLMTTREQRAYALATLWSAPALRRAVLRAGAGAELHGPWWCRLHLHHTWRRQHTEDGGRYRHCTCCGLDDDGTIDQSYGGWMGSNVPPTTGRP